MKNISIFFSDSITYALSMNYYIKRWLLLFREHNPFLGSLLIE